MPFFRHFPHNCLPHLPPAIIYCNEDLTTSVQETLVSQLFITEAISGHEFDARVSSDPGYPFIVRTNHLRILVIRPYHFGCHIPNQELADVLFFVKAGLVSIDRNCCGEEGYTVQAWKISVNKLLAHPSSNDCYRPGRFDGYECHDGYFPHQRHHERPCFVPECPECVQSNILYPLFPEAREPARFPLGSDRNSAVDTIFLTPFERHFRPAGALIPWELPRLSGCCCPGSPCPNLCECPCVPCHHPHQPDRLPPPNLLVPIGLPPPCPEDRHHWDRDNPCCTSCGHKRW
jgi:hypothetical protein